MPSGFVQFTWSWCSINDPFLSWPPICGGFPALPHHLADWLGKLSCHETCTRGLIYKGWQSWRPNLICCLYLMPLDRRRKHQVLMSSVQLRGWKRCCWRSNCYKILIELTTFQSNFFSRGKKWVGFRVISMRSWLFLGVFSMISYQTQVLKLWNW